MCAANSSCVQTRSTALAPPRQASHGHPLPWCARISMYFYSQFFFNRPRRNLPNIPFFPTSTNVVFRNTCSRVGIQTKTYQFFCTYPSTTSSIHFSSLGSSIRMEEADFFFLCYVQNKSLFLNAVLRNNHLSALVRPRSCLKAHRLK